MKAHSYDILTAPSPFALMELVNFRIAQGWQPIGGVAHGDPYQNNDCMQAMILPAKEPSCVPSGETGPG